MSNLMSFRVSLFFCFCVLISTKCAEGQIFNRYPIPDNDKDLATQLSRIKDLAGIPQDAALLYQQESEARDHADWYRQKDEQLMPGDQDVKAGQLHDDVATLRQNSAKCSMSSLGNLISKEKQIAATADGLKSVDISPFGSDRLFFPGSDDDSVDGSPIKCTDFTPALFASLDKRINESIKQHQDGVTKRKNVVGQLAAAYQDRYEALKTRLDQRSPEAWTRLLASAVILIVCIFAFGIFWLVKFFEPTLAAELINSGQLIQFPTVMILLVVIVVLGLSAILEEKTLGTLLGGIGGYVLSQGVGNSTARRVQREMTAANASANPVIPPPI